MAKKEDKIYLIGNAHLDPVWLWEWYEGYMEVKATFRSALDRMKEYPYFKFTSAAAQYYEWIKESDPEMFKEICERVREGRWCIAGGWWVQPDCNIPCEESFVRHALISQRFFKESFGETAKTGYNVDSFGHNAAIPKMLKNSGMSAYVFMRPGPHENPDLCELFNWESDDGTSVPTFRIFERYNITIGTFGEFSNSAARLDSGSGSQMAFYGVGNHGGGPTISLLNKMKAELDDRFIYSTPDEYFKDVDTSKRPVWRSDLQFHAKGCYTACSSIKRHNRKSENMVLACEKYASLSRHLLGTAYPDAELKRAWKNILFNQFHDIMGGCSIREAYENAGMQHGEAQAIADRNSNFALQQISWNIDTVYGKDVKVEKPEWGAAWYVEEFGTPFVVFNPHPWTLSTFVQFRSKPVRITDNEGNELPIQIVRASQTNGKSDKWEVGLNVNVPALGYIVLRAFYSGQANEYENKVRTTDCSLENELLKLEFNPKTGELSRIFDKKTGKDLLAGESATVMMDETDSDTWSHGIKEFQKVAEVFGQGDIHVTEQGPLRATMRTFQRGEKTTIRRDYSIVSGSDEIIVKTQIDFHEKHRMLKFRIPVNVKEPSALCQIQFGTIARPTDGTEQVCQEWAAVRQGKTGLAVLNDSKYSFDCKDNVLSLTVLRGAIFADHFGHRDEFCEYMEQGISELTYVLKPFAAVHELNRSAAQLNQRPFVVMETFHKGTLPQTYCGISVDMDNVMVTAVKKHEDSDAFVVRAYECEGKDTDVNIDLFGQRIASHFSHNQVKTFIVGAGGVRETDFLEF